MTIHRVRLLVLSTSFPNRSNPASGAFVHRLLLNLPPGYHPLVITPATDRKDAFNRITGIATVSFRYAPRKWQVLAHRPGGLSMMLKHGFWPLLLLPGFCLAAMFAIIPKTRHADLIHAQWAPNGVMAGLAGLLLHRPVITTVRGTDYDWCRTSVFFRMVMRCCLHLNQKVFAVSSEMARQLAEWFPQQRHKIHFIPNGVDVPGNPDPAGRPARFFKVAVVGNLIPEKRVDVVIRALARLRESVPDASVVVVGDGPEHRQLEDLARRSGLQDRVAFLGVVEPEKVRMFLRSCHALVLASEKEGRPNVVLEAMAAGVPVVAADIQPVRELIGSNERGLLFPPGDSEQLAARLLWLSRETDAGRALAGQALDWLRARGMTWQQTAAAYAAMYRQVLAEHNSRKTLCAG